MTLTVCILTRNDEATLGRAVESVLGVADQVVVADTGSTDRTSAEAARGGADFVEIPWDDDFSEGRNRAIARARGDWILWLNPDEEWLAPDRPTLDRQTADPSVFGRLATIRNVFESRSPDQFSETLDLRLFRNRPDLRFEGRLYPRLAEEVVETVRRASQTVSPGEPGLTIRSWSPALETSEEKLRWTTRLLSRELRDRPGRLPYLIEYGRALLLLNDPNGHLVFGEAAEQVALRSADPQPPSSKVQMLLEYLIEAPPGLVRGPMTREQAIRMVVRWFPNSPGPLWTLAGWHYRRGEYREAGGPLERLVELGATGAYDRSRPFNPAIVGGQAALNLASCYARLGRPDDAEALLRQLLVIPEYSAVAAKNLGLLGRP